MSSLSRALFLPLAAIVLPALIAGPAKAQESSHAKAPVSGMPQTIAGLGTTSFVTSTQSPEAQAAFMRGLLLLHLFEYEDAAKAFEAAERLDRSFAMAYWGEAMTYNHGVWNQVNVRAGSEALQGFAPTAAARAECISDPREKAYMGAVELLYDGTGSKVERDLRYASAMKQVAADFPTDLNAQLFYALALLGQSESVRDVPVYLHAAELAKAVFRLEPQNPGAAHYWIHGMDDPDHAAGALEPARELSKIAPDAAHAQHMCSHIFMALGMWDEVVKANLDAMRVSNLQDKAAGNPLYNCEHYQDWLEYGYLQQGRLGAARQSIADCRQSDTDFAAFVAANPEKHPNAAREAARMHRRVTSAATTMHYVEVIEAQDWTRAPLPETDTATFRPDDGAWYDFIRGVAAAQSGNLAEAQSTLEAMRSKVESVQLNPRMDQEDVLSMRVSLDELDGLVQVKAGRYDAGLARIQEGCEIYHKMAFAFGPPVTIKPPDELLGEVLLAKGDGAAARRAFEASLSLAPRRTLSLLGLARAERMAGQEAEARRTYQTLVTIWHSADADAPGVAEAKAAVGRKPVKIVRH